MRAAFASSLLLAFAGAALAAPGDGVLLPGRVSSPVVVDAAGADLPTRVRAGASGVVRARGPVLEVVGGQVEVADLRMVLRGGGRREWDGIRVSHGARLVAERLEIDCEGPGITAIRVDRGELRIRHLRIGGACVRGVAVSEAEVRLEDVVITGALRNALHVRDSRVEVVRAELRVNEHEVENGSAIFAVRSSVHASDLTASGGEFVVHVANGTMNAARLTLSGDGRSGLSLADSTVELADVSVRGPFTYSAVQISHSAKGRNRESRIDRLQIRQAGLSGILGVRASLILSDASVRGVWSDPDGDFGHAVHLQESRASVRVLEVEDAEGFALYASNAAVRLEELRARDVRGAIAAANRAHVSAHGIVVEAPARLGVLAFEKSTVTLEGARLEAEVGRAICGGADFNGAAVELIAAREKGPCPKER